MDADPYRLLAELFEAYYPLGPGERAFYERALPPGLLLELCAGTGRLTRPLAAGGRRVVAVDRSTAMLRQLVRTARAAGLSERILAVRGDARAFALGAPVAAALVGGEAYAELPERADRRALLACARAAVTSGGRVVVSAATLPSEAGEVEVRLSAPRARVRARLEPDLGRGRVRIAGEVERAAGGGLFDLWAAHLDAATLAAEIAAAGLLVEELVERFPGDRSDRRRAVVVARRP